MIEKEMYVKSELRKYDLKIINRKCLIRRSFKKITFIEKNELFYYENDQSQIWFAYHDFYYYENDHSQTILA